MNLRVIFKKFGLGKRQKFLLMLSFLVVLTATSIWIYQIYHSKKTFAAATTCYWVGHASPSNKWNDINNWDASSGGTGGDCDGGVVPGSDDTVIFNSDNTTDVDVDAAVNVKAFTNASSYNGTFTTNNYSITIANGSFQWDGGTFNAGSSTFSFTNGNIDVSAGTFNAGTGSITWNNGNALATSTLTRGTNSLANNALIINQTANWANSDIAGNTTVSSLTLTGTTNGTGVTSSSTITVTNDLTVSGGQVSSGTYNVSGNLIYSDGIIGLGTINLSGDITTTNSTWYGGGNIIWNKVGDETFTPGGRLPKLTMNTARTVTLGATLDIYALTLANNAVLTTSDYEVIWQNDLNLSGGTFNGGNSDLTWNNGNQSATSILTRGTNSLANNALTVNQTAVWANSDISGDTTISSLTLTGTTNGTGVTSGNTITVTDDLTVSGGQLSSGIVNVGGNLIYSDGLIGGGTVNLTGNITTTNSNWYGEGVIVWNKVGNETFTPGGRLPKLVFNTARTVTLGAVLDAQAITLLNGAILTTANYGVTFQNNTDLSAGTFNAGNSTLTWNNGYQSATTTFTPGASSIANCALTINQTANWANSDLAGNVTVSSLTLTGTTNGTGVTASNPVTINNDMTVSGGQVSAGTYNIAGSLIWSSGNVGSTISVAGNINRTGGSYSGIPTIILNGSGAQSVTSTGRTFYNMTVTNSSASGVTFIDSSTINSTFIATTAGTHLTFTGGTTHTWNTVNINGQSGATRIFLQSTDSNDWNFNVTTETAISNVDVSHSNANGGIALTARGSSHNSGSNSNWTFTDTFNISGTVYTAESKATNIGAGHNIGLSVNGGAKSTVASEAGGTFTFSDNTASANQTITVFVDDDATYEATLVSQVVDSVTPISGLELYTNKVVLRHETAGPMTNALLVTARTSGDTDIHYTNPSGSNITFDSGYEMWIDATKTYTPGANVIADDIDINGTFTMEANSVTCNGSWDATGGAFSSGGTVTFAAAATGKTITSNTRHFNNVAFNNAAGAWDFQDAVNIDGNLTVTTTLTSGFGANFNNQTVNIGGNLEVDAGKLTCGNGTIGITGNLTFAGGTLTSTSGTLSIAGNWSQTDGTFTHNSGTVDFIKPSGTQTVSTRGVFNNLNHSGAGTLQVLDAGGPSIQKITIDKSMVAHAVEASQTDFPVLISLTDEANTLFTTAETDGSDIYFTDSLGANIPFEIEKYVATAGLRELVAWVKISSLSSAANTDIYIKYGGGAVVHDSTAVWNSAYKAVWHLNEPSGSILDATSYNYDGSVQGGVTQNATGKIGPANSFNGTNSDIAITSTDNLNNGNNYTISAWIKGTTDGAYIFAHGNDVTNNSYGIQTTAGGICNMILKTGGEWKCNTNRSVTDDAWHFVAVTLSGTAVVDYIDNIAPVSAVSAKTISNAALSNWIGAQNRAGFYYRFAGTIDELKVSNIARSADWLMTEYNNQNSPSSYLTFALQSPSEITLSGDFNNLSGTFDLNGKTLNIGGNYANSAVFSANSGTVVMNAADTGNTLSGTMTGASSFYKLTFNNAAGGWSFSNPVSVTNNFTVTASESASNGVNLNNQTTNIEGTLAMAAGKLTAGSSNINLAGNLNFSGGTFVKNTSVLILDGGSNQSITSGGQQFNDLTITNISATPGVTFIDASSIGGTATIITPSVTATFTGGTTHTWNAITFNGQASGTKIVLQSTNGSDWNFNVTTNNGVSYVDPSHSNAAGGIEIVAHNSHDGGSNTHWNFLIDFGVTGRFYTAESKATNIGAGHNIGLSVNGGGKNRCDLWRQR